jgi:hypothetical protein
VPEADEAADIEEVQDWAAELNALHARVAGPGSLGRSHAGGCGLPARLLGNLACKNGWQQAAFWRAHRGWDDAIVTLRQVRGLRGLYCLTAPIARGVATLLGGPEDDHQGLL